MFDFNKNNNFNYMRKFSIAIGYIAKIMFRIIAYFK